MSELGKALSGIGELFDPRLVMPTFEAFKENLAEQQALRSNTFYGTNGQQYTFLKPVEKAEWDKAYDHMRRMTDDNANFDEYYKEKADLYRMLDATLGIGNGEIAVMYHPAMSRIKYWLKEWYSWGVGGINYSVRKFEGKFRRPSIEFIPAFIPGCSPHDPKTPNCPDPPPIGIPIIEKEDIDQIAKDIAARLEDPPRSVQDKTTARISRSGILHSWFNDYGENALSHPFLARCWDMLDLWVEAAPTVKQSFANMGKFIAAVLVTVFTAGTGAAAGVAIISAGVAAGLNSNQTALKNLAESYAQYQEEQQANQPQPPAPQGAEAGFLANNSNIIIAGVGAIAFVSLLLIGAKEKKNLSISNNTKKK